MTRLWLKTCGMKRLEDVELALGLGVTWVGTVLEVGRSPRSVSLGEAAGLAEAAAGRWVAVVQNMPQKRLWRVVEELQPRVVQLHGGETEEAVRELRERYPEVEVWKALGLAPAASEAETAALQQRAEQYLAAGAQALVLDTRIGQDCGGTGARADWAAAAQLVRSLRAPVVLAGGLTPGNLTEAARSVRPAGLDVSSGIEDRPGEKSPEKLRALVQAWQAL